MPPTSSTCCMVRNLSRVEPGALEQYWISTVDHGFNPSTFTARIIASTRADLVAAIVGALGALSGPLHGGAPGRVWEMLDEIGGKEREGRVAASHARAGRADHGLRARRLPDRGPQIAAAPRSGRESRRAPGEV